MEFLEEVRSQSDIIDNAQQAYLPEEEYSYNNQQIELLQNAISARKQVLQDYFKEFFGYEDKYSFNISTDEGMLAKIHNYTILGNTNYSVSYYCDTYPVVEVDSYPNYKFDYWVVNGNVIQSDTLDLEQFKDEINDGKYISISVKGHQTVNTIPYIRSVSINRNSISFVDVNGCEKEICP